MDSNREHAMFIKYNNVIIILLRTLFKMHSVHEVLWLDYYLRGRRSALLPWRTLKGWLLGGVGTQLIAV